MERTQILQELHTIAVDAYFYGYPLVLMNLTRRISTNVTAPDTRALRAPVNQFVHAPAFPTAEFRDVVRPNNDTLYSAAWLDLVAEPMVMSVPDTGGRYYLMQMLDCWTEVFASPGKRTTGTQEGHFAIAGPNWRGSLPGGVQRIDAPTNDVWVIGRVQCNGVDDYPNVHAIQRGIKLTPLSFWGQAEVPAPPGTVDQTVDMETPPDQQLARMDAVTFFSMFAWLMKRNPPHRDDQPIQDEMETMGLEPGIGFALDTSEAEVRETLEQARQEAWRRIEEESKKTAGTVNGWIVPRGAMGTYGTDYVRRAMVAHIGLGANLADDAIYPFSFADAEGRPYDGAHNYVMHFDKLQLPPVRAFWSVTLYDKDGFLVANPIGRHAIGDRDKLRFNDDGSLDIYIQHESPGADREPNWLPAPSESFNLTMRLYWPSDEILEGRWDPPPVRMS